MNRRSHVRLTKFTSPRAVARACMRFLRSPMPARFQLPPQPIHTSHALTPSYAGQRAVWPKRYCEHPPAPVARAVTWRNASHAQPAKRGDHVLDLFPAGSSQVEPAHRQRHLPSSDLFRPARHLDDARVSAAGDEDRSRAGLYDQRLLDAVLRYDGTITAEHGMGRLRAPYLAREWGPRMMGYMGRVKRIFDPDGLLNPDVMFSERALTDDLKLSW